MGKIIISENSIGFSMRDEILTAEAYAENCIRVRSTRNGRFSDERWTLNEPVKTSVTIDEKDGCASLQTGILKAEISQGWNTYNLAFYKNGQQILRTTEEGDAVRRFSHREGDLYRARALFASIFTVLVRNSRTGLTASTVHTNLFTTTLNRLYLFCIRRLATVFCGTILPREDASFPKTTPYGRQTAHIRQTTLFLRGIRLPKS